MSMKSTMKSCFKFMGKHMKTLYKFAKRNQKELKLILTPFTAAAFISFAFIGFLMDHTMNPYLVAFSKFMTMAMISILLLYCIWDLARSVLFTPFMKIVEREKENI